MRTLLLAVALFAGTFLGVRWITLGAPVPVLRVVPLKPNPKLETFAEASRRQIAEDRQREWLDSKTAQGDDDPERMRLREAVIAAATAFTGSPCNDDFRKDYIAAATAYARAFVIVGGCPKFPACRDNDAQMEQANRIFRSPADARVRDAINAVHDMGIGAKDYPDRLGMVISHLSGSGALQGGEFSCTAVRPHAKAER